MNTSRTSLWYDGNGRWSVFVRFSNGQSDRRSFLSKASAIEYIEEVDNA